MKKYIPFLSFWIINFVILFLLSLIFPKSIVFGNDILSAVFAAIWTTFILTFISWMAKPVMKKLKLNISGERKNIVFYFLVNTILIWILARIPGFTGFGISRFTWAILMGLILELFQWRCWEILKSRNTI